MENHLLNTVEYLYKELEDSGLKEKVFMTHHHEFKYLQDYLELNQLETVLFVLTFGAQVTNSSCTASFMANHLGVSLFKRIDFIEVMEGLIQRSYCDAIHIVRHRHYEEFDDETYKVNPVLYAAITKGLPLPKDQITHIPDNMEWLAKIAQFIDVRMKGIGYLELDERIEQELQRKSTGGLAELIRGMELDPLHKLFLTHVIWSALTSDEFTPADNFYKKIKGVQLVNHRETKLMIKENHPLQKRNLIVTKAAHFGSDLEVGITDEFKDELKVLGLNFEVANNESKARISMKNEDIFNKKMFYNVAEEMQLSKLSDLLADGSFEMLQKRMEQKGYSGGICTLFYGAPGTGKTESVFQLAKKTGRDIIQVDISRLKSMWFGQSQKLVKAMFTDYKLACLQCERIPILLINEADALLGKRKADTNSNTQQTENSIQNILLEEMENMKGILIATTNLQVNLDQAFDRRFLYKVKFTEPEEEQRKHIWKEKLPKLKDEDCHTLASNFNLSGGQIDNVVKKIEMDYILYGKRAKMNEIINYCQQETELKSSIKVKKIGF